MPSMDANDSVVITGISGRFASANSVDVFEQCLYDGVHLVSETDRWPQDFFGLSNQIGQIKDLSKFDAGFFGISDDEADLLDPQIRILIEVIFESICDAGENLQSMKGSKTGIYFGSFYNEIDRNLKPEHIEYMGLRQSFLGWLSYAFDVTGSCYMYETACSSSCTAVCEAFGALKRGLINFAIIATSNMNFSPSYGLIFQKLGLVSADGKCRFLDAEASGYVKSEAVTSFILQRQSTAKRVYAKIVNAVATADGYKKEGITFPKWTAQRDTIRRTYDEAEIDPLNVDYIEAHGTGTQVGDLQEIRAIYDAMRVSERTKPLLLGSVKTNIGHSEGASGLTSLLKVIFTFKNKCIPQSLHFSSPNQNIEPLINGEIKAVTTNTDFHGKIVGINSFGFGGSNVHIIVEAFDSGVQVQDISIQPNNLSRLVLFCGRTQESVNDGISALQQLYESKKLTNEYLSLVNTYAKTTFESGMNCRGYVLLNGDQNLKSAQQISSRRPLYFVFGGLGQQIKAMATPFMRFETFAKSIRKLAEIVKSQLNIDLIDIMTNENCDVDINNSIISLIPISAFQIAIVDLFVELGIKPDGYLGHSFGELACAYFDGALTQEQYISAAIIVYKCTAHKGLSNGYMAVTDLSREELLERKLEDIYLACDNSKQSITVAGNKQTIIDLMNKLKEENRFVRLVKTGGLAFHSPLVQPFFDSLCDDFNKIMPNRHKMSSKWISTSIKDFDTKLIKEELVSTYFCRCISEPVYFRDVMKMIPDNAVVVEISARKFLASILTRSLPPSVTVLHIYNETGAECNKIADRLLQLFGTIYENGFNVNIENLYPKPKYPVDCRISSISSIIRLDHSKSRLVRQYPKFFNSSSSDNFEIDLTDEKWLFLSSHRFDNQVVMPTSLYIYLICEFFSKRFNCYFNNVTFVFDNLTFHRNLIVTEMKRISFRITFIEENGRRVKVSLEHNKHLIVTCFIYTTEEIDYLIEGKFEYSFSKTSKTDEFYETLASSGYIFGEQFKQIFKISDDFCDAQIKWMQNFVIFLESIFHMNLMLHQDGKILAVKNIDCLKIDAKNLGDNCLVNIHYDKLTKETYACNETNYTSLFIRNVHFDAFDREETFQSSDLTRQIISKVPDSEDYFINYVCLENNLSKEHRLIGVAGTHKSSKFMALLDASKETKEFTIDSLLKWNIPDKWCLSESSALPHAYYIAFYSLLIRGQLRRNENVFISNAYTPIGIAAIAISFNFDCKVFASVESEEEKMQLIEFFPNFDSENIFLTMNCKTEQQIMRSTNGSGFDLMFSQIFDDSNEVTVNLIALFGRYLQVISSETHINSNLGLQIFLKNITFHGISISKHFFQNINRNDSNSELKQVMHQLIDEGIQNGIIRPFPRNLFSKLHLSDVAKVKKIQFN